MRDESRLINASFLNHEGAKKERKKTSKKNIESVKGKEKK